MDCETERFKNRNEKPENFAYTEHPCSDYIPTHRRYSIALCSVSEGVRCGVLYSIQNSKFKIQNYVLISRCEAQYFIQNSKFKIMYPSHGAKHNVQYAAEQELSLQLFMNENRMIPILCRQSIPALGEGNKTSDGLDTTATHASRCEAHTKNYMQ